MRGLSVKEPKENQKDVSASILSQDELLQAIAKASPKLAACVKQVTTGYARVDLDDIFFLEIAKLYKRDLRSSERRMAEKLYYYYKVMSILANGGEIH